eukprot:CAMPEP_0175333672 /NCGR_PEP_ID=MMETSP0095-20121207/2401_1 /TAXON_ID=311494 /ORGANISM="Alexandrium monilatum, Strain CCMP3105" /LENGTH=937 /DNA_ID=CAMNT_0016630973 /DNA_START=53 /DNA_END=2866 /DNA_ORIENTATION=+
MPLVPLSPVRVTVRTSSDGFRDWKVEVTVLPTTTVVQIREILERAPLSLQLLPEHKAMRRNKHSRVLESLDDNEKVPDEIVLTNYTPQVLPPTPQWSESPEPDRHLTAGEKESLWHRMEEEQAKHGSLPPGERRMRSAGHRRGTARRPFTIWVLGASSEVEICLAELGSFHDANFFDRQPCEVVFVNDYLPEGYRAGSEEPAEGEPPRIRTSSWQGATSWGVTKADVHVLFNEVEDVVDWACTASKKDVNGMNSAMPGIHMMTTRQRTSDDFYRALKKQAGGRLPSPIARNPFSALGGDLSAEYDDNGWSIWFFGLDTLATVGSSLRQHRQSSKAEPGESHEDRDDRTKASAIFWGIIDLKYDPSKPINERVKVLETGDGRSSRFSHAGADIPKRFKHRYKLDDAANSGKHAVVSANKKLTHDLMELYGYGHLVPRQVCCPRVYDPDLASRIVKELGVGSEELVVLKLCNRSRAAGVLPVPAEGLDNVLKEILQLPPDFEAWMQQKLSMGTDATLKVDSGCYEEQLRHWWSNECPHFVAEQFASSILTVKEYDGTMRIAFALSKKKGEKIKPGYGAGSPKSPKPDYSNPLLEFTPPADELEVEWIGGYWKLPKEDVESINIRASVISAARTAGTAHVDPQHLLEVYAAMGDSVQQLFGGSEPSPRMLTDKYSDQPELATYLTARLAIAMRDLSRVRMALKLASSVVLKASEGPAKCSAESFLNRGYGIVEALTPPYKWSAARDFFRKSVELLPANAASLYLLGMAELELGNVTEAATIMEKSLLLDLDFKAPYVNLGIAYIRLRRFDEAIEVSEALLKRHPESPQCHYHIGVACYQKAFHLENHSNLRMQGRAQEVADLKWRAMNELIESRECEEGQRLLNRGIRGGPGKTDSPWLDADDEMVEALKRGRSSSSGIGRLPPVQLPDNIGWRFFGWRN